MNALQTITDAMKRAGIIDPDEPLSNAEAESNRGRLNDMLDFWSIKRLTVQARSEDSKVLTIGDGDYTIGESGSPNIDTVRPIRIEQAYLRDSSSQDLPLDCSTLTQEQYNAIPLKNVQGLPSKLFYKPTVPNGVIYFDWLPNAAYTLYLFSWKPFTAFADLTTEYDFAPGYSAAIKANLTVLLADDYKASITERMVVEAKETLDAIKALNIEVPQIRSCGSAPGVRTAFNFRTGQ